MRFWSNFAVTLGTGMAVHAAPVVASFSPGFGPPGAPVLLQGSGLSTVTQVEFDMVLADFRLTTNGQFYAVVPREAVTGRIRVTNPTGTGVSATDFLVPPRVTGFSPPRGANGTIVRLDGVNFNGVTNVQFNGVNAAFTVTSPVQIQAAVPAGASTGAIAVRSAIGSAASSPDFVVTGPGPIVDAFNPPFAAPGAEIVIEGANFTNLLGVSFNGVGATVFSAPAYTQMRVLVPPTATTGRVTVTTTGGAGTSADNFIVTRLPVITGFFPMMGRAGQTTVTIEGVNLTGLVPPGVWFNGWPVAFYTTPAPNQIRVTVPTSATTGPIGVRNSFGDGISDAAFVVTTAPIVTSFNPPLGNPGARVTLFGDNFTGITGVTFNGVPASFLPPPSANNFDVWVPPTATSGPIQVFNNAGSFTTTNTFLVTPTFPFITRFSPNGGPRGTAVAIYGVNFGPAPVVRFNGVLDPTAYVVMEGAEQHIYAHAPAGGSTGPITVTAGTSSSTNAAHFYYPPWLEEFVPTNGFVGDQIVLTGTNFAGATRVWFGNASAPFTVEPGRIAATVPELARSGLIAVETPGGLMAGTNGFLVLPRLTNFTPALGATGTVVRISGTSLRDVSAVEFNGVSAPFTNVSLLEVTTVVPLTATTGPLRVQTPDGSATSAVPFLVVGAGDLVLSNTASAELAAPGDDGQFTLEVANEGPWTMSDVVLAGELPGIMGPITVQTDRGSCGQSNGWLICELGYLNRQGTATVRVNGRFHHEGYALFSAAVTARQDELAPANNTATAATAVASTALRSLSVARVPFGPEVVVSWPVSTIPFEVESSVGVSATNVWSTLTNAASVSEGRYQVTNAVVPPGRSYRLKARLP